MTREPIVKGKAQYVNLLNKEACFVKKKIMIAILTVADLVNTRSSTVLSLPLQ
jgi:hypothetical protein